MKKLILTLLLLSPIALPQSAQAGRVEPPPAACSFFRGETLDLKNTCTYESASWAGGDGRGLTWEDGVTTSMGFGLVGRGTPACKNTSETAVDGVCGKGYARDVRTLKRISEKQRIKLLSQDKKSIHCVEVKNKSICWLR